MKFKKLKSFGLIEALISSFIILAVIGAAVGLANRSIKATHQSASVLVANEIAQSVLEKVVFLNNSKMINFGDSNKDGNLAYVCLRTKFLSDDQNRKLCTENSETNKFSPYYGYLFRDDGTLDPKKIDEGQIIIENKANKFLLSVDSDLKSDNNLEIKVEVEWLVNDKKGSINNELVLVR